MSPASTTAKPSAAAGSGDGAGAMGDGLVEQRQRITHRTFRGRHVAAFRQQRQRQHRVAAVELAVEVLDVVHVGCEAIHPGRPVAGAAGMAGVAQGDGREAVALALVDADLHGLRCHRLAEAALMSSRFQ